MKGLEGSTLGRYELRYRIAQGGMSEVYLAYDRRVKRRVAVKVLYGSDAPFVRRFEREALAVGTLSHDHILPLYDFGEQRPWYYLVMPYVEGGTLRDYLVKRERLTLEEAGSFLEQIAVALQHAHDHGVVHRDVKPSNILLRPDGYAYLGDFGLAKAKMESETITHSGGTIVGTPEYMAPEQSNGINDYRSDIYSLGIILYQMLTGRVPFIAESPVAVSLKHIQAQPVPPSQLNSDISPAIEKVMLKALAKDPDARYQQAKSFAAAYRRALWLQQTQQDGKVVPSLLDQTEEESDDEQICDLIATSPLTTTSGMPILEHTSLPRQVSTPLFPLGKEAPSLPPLEDSHWEQRHRKRFYQTLAIPFCLVLLCISVPLALLHHAQQQHPAPQKGTQTVRSLDMSHWSTATAQALVSQQATLAAQAHVQAVAGITSAIEAGKVLYADSLNGQDRSGWLNDGRQCFFANQSYHVYTPMHGVAWCYYNQQSFSNAVITAQAQLLHGDIYGLVFRLSPDSQAFYVLELNSRGEYRFVRARGSNPLNWLTLIDWTHSNAILSGYHRTNTFLIITRGTYFTVYMNKQLLVSAFSDATYSRGFIGFLAGGDNINGTEAMFNNAWIFQR
jgi:serine/threonine protein kinase